MLSIAQGDADELAAVRRVPWPALVVISREQIAYWKRGIAAEVLLDLSMVSDWPIGKTSGGFIPRGAMLVTASHRVGLVVAAYAEIPKLS